MHVKFNWFYALQMGRSTRPITPIICQRHHPVMELNIKTACGKRCFRWVNTSQVPWAGVLGCGLLSLLKGYLGISVQRFFRWKWTCWNKLALFIRTNEMLKNSLLSWHSFSGDRRGWGWRACNRTFFLAAEVNPKSVGGISRPSRLSREKEPVFSFHWNTSAPLKGSNNH